jgi:hypothetical protein
MVEKRETGGTVGLRTIALAGGSTLVSGFLRRRHEEGCSILAFFARVGILDLDILSFGIKVHASHPFAENAKDGHPGWKMARSRRC